MEIRYLDNSGFVLFFNDITLIMDYYNEKGKGLEKICEEDLKRNPHTYVLSSHEHYDHFNKCIFSFVDISENIKYILDSGIKIADKFLNCDITMLSKGQVYKDDKIVIKVFGSTDIGSSFLIKAYGKYILHAGDLNFWHWKDEADDAYVENEKNKFLDIVNEINKETDKIDVMMFPCDYRMGDEGDAGARMIIEMFDIDMFIPMHFSNDFKRIKNFKDSIKDCNVWDIKKRSDVLFYL